MSLYSVEKIGCFASPSKLLHRLQNIMPLDFVNVLLTRRYCELASLYNEQRNFEIKIFFTKTKLIFRKFKKENSSFENKIFSVVLTLIILFPKVKYFNIENFFSK